MFFAPAKEYSCRLHMSNPIDQRARNRLLARIRRRFDVITRELSIGPLVIPFTQITNPDRVLDMVCDEADQREKTSGKRQHDDDLHLPYWAELWDSAVGLGEYLCSHRSSLATRCSVLDLGCGQGLAGAVAAALGYPVLLADVEPDALLLARLNTQQFSDVHVRRLDWRRDRLDEEFDLILGADVLYDKSQWPYLDLFWQAHLARQGSVLLGEPGRQTGEMFLEWVRSRPWKLERAEQRIASREKPIRLFRLFR